MPGRPLYLMAKPLDDVLARIWSLGRHARDRSIDLAHVTLFKFRDLEQEGPDFVPRVQSLLDGFQADAFPLSFNRIEGGEVVVIRPHSIAPASAFQRKLERFFLRQGFEQFSKTRRAHMTINYRGDDRGREAIEPIEWTVEEVLLIESVHGQTRHVEHGRWRLVRQLQLL